MRSCSRPSRWCLPPVLANEHGGDARRTNPQTTQRRLPSRVRMCNAFAHNKSGGHVRLIQPLDEPTRLLHRYGFVLVTVNQDRWRIASRYMRHRRILLQHPNYFLPPREWPPGPGLGIQVIELETGIDASVALLHEVHDVLSRSAEIQEVSRRKKQPTACTLLDSRSTTSSAVGSPSRSCIATTNASSPPAEEPLIPRR